VSRATGGGGGRASAAGVRGRRSPPERAAPGQPTAGPAHEARPPRPPLESAPARSRWYQVGRGGPGGARPPLEPVYGSSTAPLRTACKRRPNRRP